MARKTIWKREKILSLGKLFQLKKIPVANSSVKPNKYFFIINGSVVQERKHYLIVKNASHSIGMAGKWIPKTSEIYCWSNSINHQLALKINGIYNLWTFHSKGSIIDEVTHILILFDSLPLVALLNSESCRHKILDSLFRDVIYGPPLTCFDSSMYRGPRYLLGYWKYKSIQA